MIGHGKSHCLLVVWLFAALAVAACGASDSADSSDPCVAQPGLDDSWTLEASGITLTVNREPFAIAVADASGRQVLRSRAAGTADGFSLLATRQGRVAIETYVVPGWYAFDEFLEPWVDTAELLSVAQEQGRLVLHARDTAEACVRVELELRPSTLRVEATSVDGSPRAWAAAFESPAAEGFLGFGERFNRTNQRGLDVWSWAEEGGLGTGEGDLAGPANPFPNGEMMSYYPVPFFVSTEGYGFWLDTSHRSEFNLASVQEDAWRVWHTGPRMAYEIYLPKVADERPWPYQLIDLFTERTGRPMLPPPWAFGPRRRISPNRQVDGNDEMELMRAEGLALTAVDDALHFYPEGHHEGREDELASWVARARDLGLRVNGYYNSFVTTAADEGLSDWADEGRANGYFLRNPDGSYPDIWILTGGDVVELYLVDFTSPEAVEWYASSFDWALDLGYSGWMYDFGEYVPAGTVSADGSLGEELHNLYPVLYARAVFDALEADGSPIAGDWLVFMRSGYTGSSAFVPMVWTGDPAASFEDSDGLPSMIRAGVNLGISGAPHTGGDIGGFHCNQDGAEAADEELLTRWIQVGAMSPGMQDQSACAGGDRARKATIWNAPAAKEAWRKYALLHTRLFPYFYSGAVAAAETGVPHMRHPFLEHPDDLSLVNIDDAFYLGPSLYVAPVIERGATTRDVHFPPGRFLDWDARSVHVGGQTATVEAPLARLPLYLREGGLVPLLDPSIETLATDSGTAVGPADVAGVYDVRGFVGSGASRASMQLHDDTQLEVTWSGTFEAPGSWTAAASEDELATCEGCYLLEQQGPRVRLRVSLSAGEVQAGGLRLVSTGPRRIRWDLSYAE